MGHELPALLTTWEAVEHTGPGQYDTAYLDYFAEITRRAGEYGLYVFIDFHQDVWSRMSGGDGAPGWTFEAVGLDFTKFHASGAAHVMQHKYDYARGGRQEDRYPMMTWSNNYRMPANAIMWTLFFAGDLFVPDVQDRRADRAGLSAEPLSRRDARDRQAREGHAACAGLRHAERAGDGVDRAGAVLSPCRAHARSIPIPCGRGRRGRRSTGLLVARGHAAQRFRELAFDPAQMRVCVVGENAGQ